MFNLLQPDTANQLGDRKVDNLLTTGAEAVVSANPGMPAATDVWLAASVA